MLYGERQAFARAAGGLLRRVAPRNDDVRMNRFELITLQETELASPPSDFSPFSVLGLIGDTPLVKVTKFDTGPCELFLKLESQNPGGSIKDRIALAMVEAAERG